MRPWFLLLLLSVASADDDAAAVNSGKWGIGLFLQFDCYANGAWADAEAGAVVTFERVSTMSLPYADSSGHVRTREERTVSQQETRVLTAEGGRPRLETCTRRIDERGVPGEWERSRKSEPYIPEIGEYKVERVGDTTYRIDSRTIAATTYRLRRYEKDEIEDAWTVVFSGDLGVLSAKQETGRRIEWRLLRTGVEVKAGGFFRQRCREYKLTWTPPKTEDPKLAPLFATPTWGTERRVFLSPKVPGHVVRRTYAGPLETKIEENVISFRLR